LEFERSFERHRVHDPATKEKSILLIDKILSPHLNLRIKIERMMHAARDTTKHLHVARFISLAEPPLRFGDNERQGKERGQLRNERLGRSDAHLNARAGVEHELRLARDAAVTHIADRERVAMPEGFGLQ